MRSVRTKTGKMIAVILGLLLVAGAFTGCAPKNVPAYGRKDRTRIVTTIFPQYDWVLNIVKGTPRGMEVTLLMDEGVDLHSYQPTADDILTISTCDLFIYVGGESDGWVEKAVAEAGNPDMQVISLLEVLGDAAREEEASEGMQEREGDHDEGPEYDEHVWLSLRNAQVLTGAIAEAVAKVDPANAAVYEKNAENYCKKLAELDARYEETIAGLPGRTLLFADRFPFRYLLEDHGLKYYAAFAGCAAETEASFETIAFLTEKMDELGLPCVMTIEGGDRRLAETIIQNSINKDQKILTLNSLQSVTGKELEEGEDYLSLMEKNLEVLKEALQGGE